MPERIPQLSRRERQVMDILHRQGKATAADVRAAMTDPPSYSAVRTILRILETKGHVRHEQDAARYVFMPTVKPSAAKRSALRHLVNTFFEGSASKVMAALVEMSGPALDEDEIARLRHLVDEARRRKKE